MPAWRCAERCAKTAIERQSHSYLSPFPSSPTSLSLLTASERGRFANFGDAPRQSMHPTVPQGC